MTFDIIKETGMNSDLAAKFRCAVVQTIAMVEFTAMKMGMNARPDKNDMELVEWVKKSVDSADDFLGRLIKKYPDYFRKFVSQAT